MKSSNLMIILILIDSILAFIYSKNDYVIIYTTLLVLVLLVISKFILKRVED
ncbi:hypothetical protein YN1551_1398 [Sulfolobus islandicus Y.N.15.51]|uniref:Uncharacterized protein n=4 Tax=Saccharolobus TaxID=2100760 RepID=F0NHM1_SACI5|nr:hypothetical protein [Sulfolobus islandicus]ACP48489.1 hypothetical protein YN1551_1398 [Sulfolobus islandicus Y.N.15.51]ADX82745.1 hypothetical protein SiH_1396 [Sulfolobus islandicus HVE10/4]ADX85385.1 hypothetical protein SiRe_1318 [Sulfolobus islandicus REY15A]